MYGYEDYIDYSTQLSDVQSAGSVTAGLGAMWVIYLFVMLLMIVSMWRIFSKAGRPGWAAIIPIYNTIVLLDIAGYDWWYLFLFLIPIVNIVIIFKVYIDLAKKFGKSAGFGVCLVFFSIICMPVLAFGSSEYNG